MKNLRNIVLHTRYCSEITQGYNETETVYRSIRLRIRKKKVNYPRRNRKSNHSRNIRENRNYGTRNSDKK